MRYCADGKVFYVNPRGHSENYTGFVKSRNEVVWFVGFIDYYFVIDVLTLCDLPVQFYFFLCFWTMKDVKG